MDWRMFLLDPMSYTPECKSPVLCVCPYSISDLEKRHFPKHCSSQGIHYLENAMFSLGGKTNKTTVE